MMKRLSSPVAILAAALAAGAASAQTTINQDHDQHILYVWAGDQARVAPDFLAVINFDQDSPNYGKVIRTVPIPPPGNVGNEPHHCHLSADRNILGCGGLLSLLHGQNGIFFFGVADARHPKFLLSTSAPQSGITDAFVPLEGGGFLVTQMGVSQRRSARACGRVRCSLEFDQGVAGKSALGRVQPPRDLRASRP
jgi:hypothetical protein